MVSRQYGMAEGKERREDNPYSILQVGRTADIFEIRKSYQQLARTVGNCLDSCPRSHARFVRELHEILSGLST